MTDGTSALQSKLHNTLQQLMEITAQNETLRAENTILKRKLNVQQLAQELSVNGADTSTYLPKKVFPQAKISMLDSVLDNVP